MSEYDSDYEVRLATLGKLGGDTTKQYDSVYEIDLAILEKTGQGGGGGAVIDDNTVSTGSTYSSSKIMEVVQGAGFDVQIVEELPESGYQHTIYFVPAEEAATLDIYDEYLWVNSAWEKIGSTSIDLSNYYTSGQTDTLLEAKQDTLTAGSNVRINSANTITCAGVSAGDGINVAYNPMDNVYGVSIKAATAGSRGGVSIGDGISVDNTGHISVDTTTIQAKLTAGDNVQISGDTISATDTTYTASDFDIKDLADSTGLRTTWSAKQDALTAGTNITISGNTISADLSDYYTSGQTDNLLSTKQGTLTAGSHISISNNNEISTTGLVASTGVTTIWKGSQSDYDQLGTYDNSTLYIIQ